MATGKAVVRDADPSTVSSQVHKATGDAVRAAQIAGKSKKEVIQARDSAKNQVYSNVVANIRVGGSGADRQLAELQSSRDHALNLKAAGLLTPNENISNTSGVTSRLNNDPARVLSAHPPEISLHPRFRHKNVQEAVIYHVESDPQRKKLVNDIRKAKNESYVVDALFNLRKLDESRFVRDRQKAPWPKKEKKLTDPLYTLSESVMAGYYGDSTALTDKIDQNTNVATDWLDGTASTLKDPARLRKSHENPNMIAGKDGGIGDKRIITPVDKFVKSKNPVARFIRGATVDNAAGLLTLGSEAIKTSQAAITDMPVTASGSMNNTANIVAAGAGRLIGGTAAAAKDDPIAFTGSVVAPGFVKIGGKVGKTKVKGTIATKGTKFEPLSTFTDQRLVDKGGEIFKESGKGDKFYTVKGMTVPEVAELFEKTPSYYPNKSVIPEGKVAGIHTTPADLGKKFEVQKGTSSEVGLFAADKASPYFLKVPEISITGIGFSNPLKDAKSAIRGKKHNPSINFIEADRVQIMPDSATKSDKASAEFIMGKKADPTALITTRKLKHNLERGAYTEVEAVVKPGVVFELVDKSYYTKVKQPITIFGKEFETDVKIPLKYYKQTGKQTKTIKNKSTGKTKKIDPSSSYADSYSPSKTKVPVIDFTYSIKPSLSSKRKTAVSKSKTQAGIGKSEMSGTATSYNSLFGLSNYGAKTKPSKAGVKRASDYDLGSFLSPPASTKTKVKKTKPDEFLNEPKRKKRIDDRSVLKEYRKNPFGDLKLW